MTTATIIDDCAMLFIRGNRANTSRLTRLYTNFISKNIYFFSISFINEMFAGISVFALVDPVQ